MISGTGLYPQIAVVRPSKLWRVYRDTFKLWLGFLERRHRIQARRCWAIGANPMDCRRATVLAISQSTRPRSAAVGPARDQSEKRGGFWGHKQRLHRGRFPLQTDLFWEQPKKNRQKALGPSGLWPPGQRAKRRGQDSARPHFHNPSS